MCNDAESRFRIHKGGIIGCDFPVIVPMGFPKRQNADRLAIGVLG